jgi:hypothetical protein
MDGWIDRYLDGGEHKTPPPNLNLFPLLAKSKLKLSNNNKSKAFFLVAKSEKLSPPPNKGRALEKDYYCKEDVWVGE